MIGQPIRSQGCGAERNGTGRGRFVFFYPVPCGTHNILPMEILLRNLLHSIINPRVRNFILIYFYNTASQKGAEYFFAARAEPFLND